MLLEFIQVGPNIVSRHYPGLPKFSFQGSIKLFQDLFRGSSKFFLVLLLVIRAITQFGQLRSSLKLCFKGSYMHRKVNRTIAEQLCVSVNVICSTKSYKFENKTGKGPVSEAATTCRVYLGCHALAIWQLQTADRR